MNIEPIAFFRSPFTTKFGIPRQSGIVDSLHGRIEFVAPYNDPEALRGLDGYDYLWLIWGFSENTGAAKHPTVRPPLLGGNEYMGVWATRSPFRPNNLGLSAVRIAAIDVTAPAIEVTGADLMDGTPIYDIKPYLPYVDSHPEARGGFTDQHSWKQLQVKMSDEATHQAEELLNKDDMETLRKVIALDPRPHYHDDPERLYGMPFKGCDIRFRVMGDVAEIEEIAKA